MLGKVIFFLLGTLGLVAFIIYTRALRRGIKPKKRWNLDKCTTGKVLRVIQDVTHHGGDESYTYSPLVEYSVEGVIPIYFLAFIFMMYGCAVLGADAFFSLFKMS